MRGGRISGELRVPSPGGALLIRLGAQRLNLEVLRQHWRPSRSATPALQDRDSWARPRDVMAQLLQKRFLGGHVSLLREACSSICIWNELALSGVTSSAWSRSRCRRRLCTSSQGRWPYQAGKPDRCWLIGQLRRAHISAVSDARRDGSPYFSFQAARMAMVSSTVGSLTRHRLEAALQGAASFSMYLRYSSRGEVAPLARSSPPSRPASACARIQRRIAAARQAPTIVCGSSLNRMMLPCALLPHAARSSRAVSDCSC